jgi:2-alkenal reductase
MVATGTVLFALTFPDGDSNPSTAGTTPVTVAEQPEVDPDETQGSQSAGQVTDRLASTAALALGSLSSAAPDLSVLFEAVNPGVVAVHALRNVQFADAEVGADGSGWVFDDRHIVTNHHVVEGASELSITFADGTEAPATLVGSDDDADLAVLAVEVMPASARALPLVTDFDSLKVGEPVVAIGNPFGLNNTITSGIISALGRIIPSAQGQTPGASQYSIPQTIQTDAAINPGNSGGPLVNMKGEVVGINAQIRTNGVAANSGVGFAVPASVAARVVPGLIRDGEYTWSFLGVSGTSVSLRIAEANDLDQMQGAYILTVLPDGPSNGRLQGARGLGGNPSAGQSDTLTSTPTGGDIVVSVEGEPVNSFADLLTYVALETRPGDTIDLTVLRDGQEQRVQVTLGSRPD